MLDGLIILFVLLYFVKRPYLLSPEYLDQYIIEKENKSKIRWILWISFGLMFLAALYCLPSVNCSVLGHNYKDLATNPFLFDATNPVAFRILTPLISYLLGLRGQGIIITNILLSILMIGVIYNYFRSISKFPSDGLFAAFVITFSMVILSTLHNGGYCDILTYLIIFLMWRYKKHRFLFYLLFFLGLLNRESIAFLLPWFFFISYQDNDNKKMVSLDLIIGFSLTLLLYYFYREWILSIRDVTFSTSYYLDPLLQDPFVTFRKTLSNQGIGLFSVFKLFWIIPILYVYSQYKLQRYKPIFEILLIIFCCYLQLLIAYDTTRMFTQAFMVIIISLKGLYESDFAYLRKYQFWLVGLTLLVPQVNTASNIVEIWNSTFLFVVESLIK